MIPRLAITLVAALLGGIQDQPSAPQEQAVSDAIVEGDSAQAAPVSPDRVEMDRQIREDLMATFGRIPGLEGVEARVEAGVVFLAGTVLTTDRYALADSLASRMPGVLYVDNGITEETSLRVRLNPVWADLQQRALRGLALIPLLLVVAGVTLFFLFLARGIYRWEALFNRLGTNPFLRNLLRQGAAGVVALLGVLLALELLDATALVGAVLGAAGVMGIAVGFAFRNIAENYLAGIILSVRQPFFPNDQV
ncbi:MAG: mechanosensitive ion channel, partial [Longimicrobiales bacterium]|nr:mechanosensitive ion channel [Longimicrobiales bacterium]